jgi:hypothetical protein
MKVLFIGIKIIKDQEAELNQCNYAKYSHKNKTAQVGFELRALSL